MQTGRTKPADASPTGVPIGTRRWSPPLPATATAKAIGGKLWNGRHRLAVASPHCPTPPCCGLGGGAGASYVRAMSNVAPAALPLHPDVSVEAEQRVWDGRFPLDRVRFRYRRFDGSMSGVLTWELWRRGRAAALLPYDPTADAVVLIDQFRLPALAAGLDPVLVEIPAGLADRPEFGRGHGGAGNAGGNRPAARPGAQNL